MKVKNKHWYSFLNLVLHVAGIMLVEYSDFEVFVSLKVFYIYGRGFQWRQILCHKSVKNKSLPI